LPDGTRTLILPLAETREDLMGLSLSRSAICAGVLGFALAGLAPGAAEAATCRIITYYSDASMNRTVGVWSNCPGMKGLRGRRTRYSESETQQIRGPSTGPGSLPCEFLQKGCSPIPSPR